MSIIINHLAKTYAENSERQVTALNDLNLALDDHEFVSVVGPSGCGKTTLLKILAGLIEQNSGTVEFRGEHGETRPTTALVFQDQGLLPWLTVGDNIGLGLELQRVPAQTRKARVLQFMERIKLDGFEAHYPHELSGGMRQRVALARAFLTNPDILLMDEPFAALDAQTRIILQEELLAIWSAEKKMVLFVTHDIDEAMLLSDRVVVMTDRPGSIKQEFPIPLDRPRTFASKDSPELKDIRLKIWKLLETEVRKDLKLT